MTMTAAQRLQESMNKHRITETAVVERLVKDEEIDWQTGWKMMADFTQTGRCAIALAAAIVRVISEKLFNERGGRKTEMAKEILHDLRKSP